MKQLYPLWVSIAAAVCAQILKPFIYYIKHRKWIWHLALDSGGLPSSHSAMVASLALSVGLLENFSSTIFTVTVVFAVIIMYDAANVRYYAGRNIQITKQLIKDFKSISNEIDFNDPIYQLKVKEVLGHKWIEVITGAILGIIIAALSYLVFKY